MAAPVLIPIVTELVGAFAGGLAYEAVNNYISHSANPDKTPKGAPDITPIPTSKPKQATVARNLKQNLGGYAAAIATAMIASSESVKKATEEGKNAISASSAEQKAKTTELLTASQNSPLLQNQVFIKDSIDKLIEAINVNAIVTATVFGTLDVNLSSIGSSLTSISSTLIDISLNYQEDISNTGDVPYINQAEYYKQLAERGVPADKINELMAQENAYINSLKSKGDISYSDLKKSVADWRAINIPTDYQDYVDDWMSGVSGKGWHGEYTVERKVTSSGETVKELVKKSASPSSTLNATLEVPNLEAWAESQLGINSAIGVANFVKEHNARMEKNEFATTALEVKDLDGNVVANMKPIELQAIKNATDAKLRTDMNNLEFDGDDIDFSMGDGLDLSSLFQFDKKSIRLQDLKTALGV